MFDNVFFVVLILNGTGLFSFLAPQFGTEISQVSLVLLVLNLLYLASKPRYSAAVALRNGMGGWLFMLLVWPLLTVLYAPSLQIREIGLQLYYVSLLYGTIVYTMANGLPSMHRMLGVSLAVTILGLALSMTAPQYFEAVSELAGANVLKEGRACGFLLQPNSLANAIGFLFIGWFALWRRRKPVVEVGIILGFLLAVLLTGSRTGILMAVIITAFILLPSSKKAVASGVSLLRAGLLIGCLASGIVGMKYYLSHIGYVDVRRQDLVNRMETMLSFKLSDDGNISDDGSIRWRLAAQQVYWSLFRERPFFGHGFGSNVYYHDNGPIFLAAHSQALTCAMEYGALYPFVFGVLMLQLYRKRVHCMHGKLHANSIGQFVFVMLFLFPINGNLFGNRTFYVVWGMFLAAAYYPEYVFRHEQRNEQPEGVLMRPVSAAPRAESERWRSAARPSIPTATARTSRSRALSTECRGG